MTELLNSLNDLGGSMAGWWMLMTLWTGAMLLLALAANRLLARRVSPTWRALLFIAVLARVALPVNYTTPVGMIEAGPGRSNILIWTEGVAASTAPYAAAAVPPGSSGVRDTTAWAVTWRIAVPVLYGVGAVCLGILWWRSRSSIRRIVREATPARDSVRAAVGESAVDVREHASAGPMLVGTWRSCLVIPRELAESPSRLRWVIRHEVAHIRRGDPVVAALLRGAVLVCWPILPVWIAARRIRTLMEQACDARALRQASASERADYGRTLVDLATATGRPRTGPVTLVPALSFGSDLRSRLVALRHTRRWSWAIQAPLALGLVMAMIACAAGRMREEEPPARFENASAVPHKGSIAIQAAILTSWPADHPKLQFNLIDPAAPRRKSSTDERDIPQHLLSAAEYADIIAWARKNNAILSMPRLEVILAAPATIRVGNDGDNGVPIDGFNLGITVASVSSEAATPTRWDHTLDVDFEMFERGLSKFKSNTTGWKIPGGQAGAILTPRYVGHDNYLLLIAPRPDPNIKIERAAEDAPGAALPDKSKYPFVEMHIGLDEIPSVGTMEALLKDIGGMKVEFPAIDTVKALNGAVVYQIPDERIEDLYKRAAGLPKGGFVKGASPLLTAFPGESARLVWQNIDTNENFDLTVTGHLVGPANKPGTIQGGELALSALWAFPGTKKHIKVPATVVQNYNASGHWMSLVILAPPELVGGPNKHGRMLVITGKRVGSQEEVPVQTLELGAADEAPVVDPAIFGTNPVTPARFREAIKEHYRKLQDRKKN